MTRQVKILVSVGLLLAALIVLPLLVLLFSRMGGAASPRAGANRPVESVGAVAIQREAMSVVGFELRQLRDQAEDLLSQRLAAALRAGDVSLELIASLTRSMEQARAAFASGDLDRAASLFRSVLERGTAELERLALADQARVLRDATYADLRRLEYLKPAFEQTYQAAVAQYDAGLHALEVGTFESSVAAYKMAGAILGDLEARGLQQLGGFLELGQQALRVYDLKGARAAFEAVLQLDTGNAAALVGLDAVQDLAGIADAVPPIEALERAGELDPALAAWGTLATAHPENAFLEARIGQVQAQIVERDYTALLEQATTAEAAGAYPVAIAAVESALALRSSVAQLQRLEDLRAKFRAAQLEQSLSTGFAAVQAGRFESARDAYRESVALAPDSKEARVGFEKASSLYLASIRYEQSLQTAIKYAQGGRYPLAAKFFNTAMTTRPSSVRAERVQEEQRLRELLELQSAEVLVTVQSDKRTYVSIIGVLPPDRFSTTSLELFPDVYTIKGTRAGYVPVEIELKLDARQPKPIIEVKCSEKL